MSIKSRSDLQGFFSKGKRPKQEEFWHWMDSFYHKTEDPINISGWTLRSFFKELRGDGLAITTGGMTVIDIPYAVKRLKKVRVMGRGTFNTGQTSFTVSVNLVYACDKLIPGFNGIAAPANFFPAGFFLHPIIGFGTANPPVPFDIVSTAKSFAGEIDFSTLGMNVLLDHDKSRIFRLTIQITNGTFPNTSADPSFLFYGFEYE